MALSSIGFVVVILSSLIATDVIPAGSVVTASNTTSGEGTVTSDDRLIIGREVRRTVYAGQEVQFENTRSALLVKRNNPVVVKYVSDGLEIIMTGRAMSNAGAGELITVMNTDSRAIVHGRVMEQGWVRAE